jgi:hypothetical protein
MSNSARLECLVVGYNEIPLQSMRVFSESTVRKRKPIVI